MKLLGSTFVLAVTLSLYNPVWSTIDATCTVGGGQCDSTTEVCVEDTGLKCKASPCVAEKCSNHGTCTPSAADKTVAECKCEGGYTGTTCDGGGNPETTTQSKGTRVSEACGQVITLILSILVLVHM